MLKFASVLCVIASVFFIYLITFELDEMNKRNGTVIGEFKVIGQTFHETDFIKTKTVLQLKDSDYRIHKHMDRDTYQRYIDTNESIFVEYHTVCDEHSNRYMFYNILTYVFIGISGGISVLSFFSIIYDNDNPLYFLIASLINTLIGVYIIV